MFLRIREEIKKLHPAYFGLVMSTGIVSIGMHFLGWPILPRVLLWVNIFSYVILWIMNILRIVIYPRRFLVDMSDHLRGVGFFTFVAATGVLAAQLIVISDDILSAKILWYLGAGLWLLFMYGIFFALTVKKVKPNLAEGINGGWLVAVVATQSLCIVGCLAPPELGIGKEGSLTIMLALWLCGGMLYIWLISLIFYRYTFFILQPSDLMPPYWINMGAMAISTLAGSMLIQRASDSPLLLSILPFLKGFTLWYWATATWWIPLMVLLAIWRHGIRRFPFSYDQGYWGVVFPLGMYTACTFQLGQAIDSSLISAIPLGFVYISVPVWGVIFYGLLRRMVSILFD
jgi:tellurite resistance protein TehA-like permease|tara:strand:- start:393 stop:1424 length:1032 start_codon:yes stop_codon:yes gene_type:complete